MKKRLTIVVIVMVLTATASLVTAGPNRRGTEALPASVILTNVRLMGLYPTSSPRRRGPYYVMHAVDPRGTALRVVADAELGDIVSLTPVFAPRFDAGPRIIHVPQPGERTGVGDRDEAALPDEAIEQYAPPPRRRAISRPVHRSEPRPAPPPRPRRNVLSLPPNGVGLSPVHPTPQFSDRLDAKAEAEKFSPPEPPGSRPPAPGTAPPAAAPAQNEQPKKDSVLGE